MKKFKIKKIILTVAIACGITSIAQADQCSGFYVKAETGYSFSNNADFDVGQGIGWGQPQDDFSNEIGNSWLWGAGLGYRINPLIRTDITYDRRAGFEYSKSFYYADRHRQFDITNQTVMANLYLDANGIRCVNFGRFNPFIGGGIGYARNTGSDFTSTDISTGFQTVNAANTVSTYSPTNHFAWQFTLGTAFNLCKHLDLDAGYRYVNIGDIQAGPKQLNRDAPNFIRSSISTNNASMQEVYGDLRYSF